MASDDEERMRADWEGFVTRWPMFKWFEPIEYVEPAAFAPSSKLLEAFPKFASLLQRARRHEIYTDATSNRRLSHLFAWDAKDGETFGWLCDAPSTERQAQERVKSLKTLMESFGGLRESWNVQGDLLTNVNEGALARSSSFGSWNDRTLWNAIYRPLSDDPPVRRFARRFCNLVRGRRLDDTVAYGAWRVFAYKGNGSQHIVNLRTEEVRYAASDPGLERARLDDLPFYALDGVPDLRSWVELVAQQHLDALA